MRRQNLLDLRRYAAGSFYGHDKRKMALFNIQGLVDSARLLAPYSRWDVLPLAECDLQYHLKLVKIR